MDLDWSSLGFAFMETNGFVRVDFKDGKWGDLEFKKGSEIPLHVGANCLHYGQSCFEGLKAFTTKKGDVAIFRPDENAKRMKLSADRICMQAPPEDLFIEACKLAVSSNLEYVPPYGHGASLYIRPLLIGTEGMFGVNASSTFSLFVLVSPVGPYYKNGFSPVKALVVEEFDRAAPQGTGMAKVAGNYAASLISGRVAKEKGFPIVLYLDSKENKYIDEFSTSNFIGITEDRVYKTPNSASILQSITNKSLRVLASDLGLTISEGPVSIDEIDQFVEVGACGTAAIVTPIESITYKNKVTSYGEPGIAGNFTKKLYDSLQAIQYGDQDDLYQWLFPV